MLSINGSSLPPAQHTSTSARGGHALHGDELNPGNSTQVPVSTNVVVPFIISSSNSTHVAVTPRHGNTAMKWKALY